MTFQPKPTFFLKINEEFYKNIVGTTQCEVICSKSAGVVRPKGFDPFEAELLLVKSNYKYIPNQLDLTVLDQEEPGNHKWYLVMLPLQAELRRRGQTHIAKYHLAIAKSYDTYAEGLEAWGAVKCLT
jgi:hypothetical protein